ncbi:hypothetical protein LMOSLCC2755_0581 [Listeria monocytogenes SLCC2755]|nr:hypothetical protein LMOSLCC2755_0581 [Listeria monocytogenes SLCC2755]
MFKRYETVEWNRIVLLLVKDYLIGLKICLFTK